MVSETKPDHKIDKQEIEASDPEVTSYLRAFAELIFDAWKEQHSASVKPEKALDISEKNNIPV